MESIAYVWIVTLVFVMWLLAVNIGIFIVHRLIPPVERIADALDRAYPKPKEIKEITDNDITTAFCEMKGKETPNA